MKFTISFCVLTLFSTLIRVSKAESILPPDLSQVPPGFVATFHEIPCVPDRSVEANQFWDLSGQRILHSSNGIQSPSFDLSYMRGAKWMAYELTGYFKALETGDHTFQFRNNNDSSFQIGAGSICYKDAHSSVSDELDIDPTNSQSTKQVTVHLEKNRYYPLKIVDCHQGPHFDASILLSTLGASIPRVISDEIVQFKFDPDFVPATPIEVSGSQKKSCEPLEEDGTGLRFRAFQLKFNNKFRKPEGYVSHYRKTPVRAEGQYNRLDWVPKVYDMELKEKAFALELVGYLSAPGTGTFTLSLKARGTASLQIGPGVLLSRQVEMKEIDESWIKIDTRVANRKKREIKTKFQTGLKYPIRAVLINDNSRPKLELLFSGPSGEPLDFTSILPLFLAPAPVDWDNEIITPKVQVSNPDPTASATLKPLEEIPLHIGEHFSEPSGVSIESPISQIVVETSTDKYEREVPVETSRVLLEEEISVEDNLVEENLVHSNVDMKIPDLRLLFAEESTLLDEFEAFTDDVRHAGIDPGANPALDVLGDSTKKLEAIEEVDEFVNMVIPSHAEESPLLVPSDAISPPTSLMIDDVVEQIFTPANQSTSEQAIEATHFEVSQSSELAVSREAVFESTITIDFVVTFTTESIGAITIESIVAIASDSMAESEPSSVESGFTESLAISTKEPERIVEGPTEEISKEITDSFQVLVYPSGPLKAVYSNVSYELQPSTNTNIENGGLLSQTTRLNDIINFDCNLNASCLVKVAESLNPGNGEQSENFSVMNSEAALEQPGAISNQPMKLVHVGQEGGKWATKTSEIARNAPTSSVWSSESPDLGRVHLTSVSTDIVYYNAIHVSLPSEDMSPVVEQESSDIGTSLRTLNWSSFKTSQSEDCEIGGFCLPDGNRLARVEFARGGSTSRKENDIATRPECVASGTSCKTEFVEDSSIEILLSPAVSSSTTIQGAWKHDEYPILGGYGDFPLEEFEVEDYPWVNLGSGAGTLRIGLGEMTCLVAIIVLFFFSF